MKNKTKEKMDSNFQSDQSSLTRICHKIVFINKFPRQCQMCLKHRNGGFIFLCNKTRVGNLTLPEIPQ